MNSRETFIKEFRGQSLGEIKHKTADEEIFQNKTLRPILKLQNELILLAFESYLDQNKILFNCFSSDKKMKTIESILLNDSQFRNLLKGFVLGLFTIEEYAVYAKNKSELNKRIRTMLVERLQSQLQLTH
jgi:hypothetical protein